MTDLSAQLRNAVARAATPDSPERRAALSALLSEMRAEYQGKVEMFISKLRDDIAEIEACPDRDDDDLLVLTFLTEQLRDMEAELVELDES